MSNNFDSCIIFYLIQLIIGIDSTVIFKTILWTQKKECKIK